MEEILLKTHKTKNQTKMLKTFYQCTYFKPKGLMEG